MSRHRAVEWPRLCTGRSPYHRARSGPRSSRGSQRVARRRAELRRRPLSRRHQRHSRRLSHPHSLRPSRRCRRHSRPHRLQPPLEVRSYRHSLCSRPLLRLPVPRCPYPCQMRRRRMRPRKPRSRGRRLASGVAHEVLSESLEITFVHGERSSVQSLIVKTSPRACSVPSGTCTNPPEHAGSCCLKRRGMAQAEPRPGGAAALVQPRARSC
jgi:hypothetical protein